MFKKWRFSKTLCLLYLVSIFYHEWSVVGMLQATIAFYISAADIFMVLIFFDLVRTKVTGKSIWIAQRES